MTVASDHEGGRHAHQDKIEVLNPRGDGELDSGLTWDQVLDARDHHSRC